MFNLLIFSLVCSLAPNRARVEETIDNSRNSKANKNQTIKHHKHFLLLLLFSIFLLPVWPLHLSSPGLHCVPDEQNIFFFHSFCLLLVVLLSLLIRGEALENYYTISYAHVCVVFFLLFFLLVASLVFTKTHTHTHTFISLRSLPSVSPGRRSIELQLQHSITSTTRTHSSIGFSSFPRGRN